MGCRWLIIANSHETLVRGFLFSCSSNYAIKANLTNIFKGFHQNDQFKFRLFKINGKLLFFVSSKRSVWGTPSKLWFCYLMFICVILGQLRALFKSLAFTLRPQKPCISKTCLFCSFSHRNQQNKITQSVHGWHVQDGNSHKDKAWKLFLFCSVPRSAWSISKPRCLVHEKLSAFIVVSPNPSFLLLQRHVLSCSSLQALKSVVSLARISIKFMSHDIRAKCIFLIWLRGTLLWKKYVPKIQKSLKKCQIVLVNCGIWFW